MMSSSSANDEAIYENEVEIRVATSRASGAAGTPGGAAAVQQSDWTYGLFGCFDDPKLCLLTFFLPCYAIGMNAGSLSEDCLVHGLLPLVGLNFGPVIRWRLRQERNIQGSMLHDVLLHTFCPCCALVQEAREIGWTVPQDLDEIGRPTSSASNTQPKRNNETARARVNTDSGSSTGQSQYGANIDRQ